MIHPNSLTAMAMRSGMDAQIERELREMGCVFREDDPAEYDRRKEAAEKLGATRAGGLAI